MSNKKVLITSTGAMGSAIAKTLLASGYDVVVWNRNLSKSEQLVTYGAVLTHSIIDAIDRVDIIIAVPNPASAINRYLLTEQLMPHLTKKTIILMSSYQSLDEPKEIERRAQQAKALFLDGKIFCYPSEIGQQDTALVFSGQHSVFESVAELLSHLGKPIYLGADIERAFIYECAITSLFVSITGNINNTIALLEQANIPPDTLIDGVSSCFTGLEKYLTKVVRDMLPENNFDTTHHGTASTQGILDVMRHFYDTFHHYGVLTPILDSVIPFMKTQTDQGKGQSDMAAMIGLYKSNT